MYPSRVIIVKYSPGSKSVVATTAAISSPSPSFKTFTADTPRAVLLLVGTSYTFNRYTRPKLVKQRR